MRLQRDLEFVRGLASIIRINAELYRDGKVHSDFSE